MSTPSTSLGAGEELCARLGETPIKTLEVARYLDGLTHTERVQAVRSLGKTEQRRLYAAVEGFAPLRLVDIVPANVRDLVPVRHYGKNSLLAPLSLFEKRFARPSGQRPEAPEWLCGYNYNRHPLLAAVAGPGYFIAREDKSRGEVLVDYREIPSERPAAWPEVRSNERGFARFIFGFMVDALRRVSQHVSIGSAARYGKDLGSWFVLCREP